MIIPKKSFEEWLQTFNPDIRIMEHLENQDIDVLYFGERQLGSVPKGLKDVKDWNIADKREGSGHLTSDNIVHRSLEGVGTLLLMSRAITPHQFMRHFLSSRNQEALRIIKRQGYYTTERGIKVPL